MKKILLSMFALLTMGASALAQISTMPYSTDFSETNPFDVGSVVDGTNVKSVLNVNNTTATAAFWADGAEAPYTLAENEEVTVSFTAFHGWLTNGANQTISLLNSDDVVLASYTYNLGSCNLTAVTAAGKAASITPYNLQSKAAAKNANGLDNGKAQGYVTTDGYNPVITFTVSESGRCAVNIKKGVANIDNTYADNVAEGVKMDLAKIVITCGSNNGDRTICIDNLSISSVINQTPKADFTIKYVNELGDEIKTSTTGNDQVGANPTIGASDKENVIVGDVKYVYASDNAASQTIANDGSTVVTITFNTINKIDYSVTSSLGATIANGQMFADETAFVTWNKCIDVEGKMYATEAPYSVTLTSEAPTKVVEYTESSDIAYFFEAESILSRSYGNPNGDYSGGTSAGVYTGATLTMPNIAAGDYTITVNSSVRRSNEDALNVQISTDGETWEDAGVITLTSNVGGDYSADVTLPADGSIRLVEGKGMNMCHYVDYVIVKKVASIPVAMTVSDAKYSTFCAPFDAPVPAGVTASTATLDGTTLVLASVGETIPANTPVILYSDSEVSTTVSGKAVAGEPVAGVLTGVYADTTAPMGSYVLQNQNDKVAFYLVDSEITVPANKAYLTVSSSESGAKAINFPSTTAISAIEALTSGKAEIYSVNGAKQNKLQKGINIVNGVKVMVK